jgi:hypothetical protein
MRRRLFIVLLIWVCGGVGWVDPRDLRDDLWPLAEFQQALEPDADELSGLSSPVLLASAVVLSSGAPPVLVPSLPAGVAVEHLKRVRDRSTPDFPSIESDSFGIWISCARAYLHARDCGAFACPTAAHFIGSSLTRAAWMTREG